MFICDSFNLLLNLWVNMLGEMRAIFLRLQKIMFQPPSPDCRMSRLHKDWRGPSERPVQAAPGWTSNTEEHVWNHFLFSPLFSVESHLGWRITTFHQCVWIMNPFWQFFTSATLMYICLFFVFAPEPGGTPSPSPWRSAVQCLCLLFLCKIMNSAGAAQVAHPRTSKAVCRDWNLHRSSAVTRVGLAQ